ncbi:MAG TPA: deoxyguanosinetriphosphate triphosphohydrolase, partial [Candidatus Ratteibacteria bacterium]|nr:deoxyguanosinetriphosphate triphosphohydrolase [Candidatus Ratteibacteria bacterium]
VICQSIENIEKSGVSSIEDVRNTHILITHSEEVIRKHTQLRKFLEENMYENYRVIRMAKKAERIITDLFNAYLNEPKQLPPHIQKKMEYEPKEIVICDYIAGMTDRFAQLEYQKLFNLESLV